MIYGRSELRRRLKDAGNKGVTNSQLIDMVESLWRDPYSMRTSGFNIAGGTDAQISFSDSTRTFSIAPVDKKFSFYQFLFKLAFFKKRSQEEVQIADVEGWHMIYYYFDEEDASGPQKLYAIANPDQELIKDAYLNKVLIAWIYWDFNSKKAIYFGDERHGSEWNPQIHWWAHESFNAIRKSGLRITDITIGDGSQNVHALFGISAGSFYHEDIYVETPSLVPGNNFPLYYFSNGKPRLITNSNFAINKAGSFIDFNINAYSLANMTDGNFQLVHVFAANCRVNPLFAYMGIDQYPDPRSAGENLIYELDTVLSLMAQQTRFYIGSVLFHASSQYINEVKAKVFAEVTPEILMDIISKDNTPFLKTGWSPDVMKQVYWYQNDTDRRIFVAPASSAPYFVEGEKYFLNSVFVAQFADETALKYVSARHGSWNLNKAPFTGYENHFAFTIAAYYNSRKGYFVYAGWRMHMWEMESKTRGNIIKKTGLEHVSGLEISFIEELGQTHMVNVSDGVIRLADIEAKIAHGSGFTPHEMHLRPLEARKHFLITYFDNTDPENVVITHEWEIDNVVPTNIATLSDLDEVLINTYNTVDGWHLQYTYDGDYSAMWLIGTLDYRHPLKWITGAFADESLEIAKELNDPVSLLEILSAAPMLDYSVVLARVMIKNIPDEPFYSIEDVKEYEDGEFDAILHDRHVVDMHFDDVTRELTLFRNAGLEQLKVVIPGGNDDEVEFRTYMGWIQWKYISHETWIQLYEIPIPEDGTDGREVEMNVVGDFIVWRYVGSSVWINLISLSMLKGLDGREIQLDVISGYIVWRFVGDLPWINLISVASLQGANGREIELRENEGWVQWRYITDIDWIPLYEIPTSSGGGVAPVVVQQENHGFTGGQAIRHDGAIYVLAIADNDVNAQVCGIVANVVDANVFTYVTDGFISGGWVAGQEYFLSPDTPGLLIPLSDPEIWAVGQVRISLGWGTTSGLKVEIDVGDLIEELPTVKLVGVWDREAEFCINQGTAETFTLDFFAVYPYEIVQLIAGVDDGSLPGSSIEINGIPVTGLSNFTVGIKQAFTASALNLVSEGNEVAFKTSGDFTGNPAVVKVKLKILRQ